MMSYRKADSRINMAAFPSAAFVINVLIFPCIYSLVVQGSAICYCDFWNCLLT